MILQLITLILMMFGRIDNKVSVQSQKLKCEKDEDCIKHTTVEMEEQLVCHDQFCFGVPFFYHVENKCESDKDCRFYYKCHIPEKKICECKTNTCQDITGQTSGHQEENVIKQQEFDVDTFEPFPTGH